jgi:hypothetical protein
MLESVLGLSCLVATLLDLYPNGAQSCQRGKAKRPDVRVIDRILRTVES